LFYAEHQLRNPIVSLFEPLVDDPDVTIFGYPEITEKIDVLRNRAKDELKTTKRIKKNKANNQREITSFFKPK
jgi:DNA polymerase delta subunit 1